MSVVEVSRFLMVVAISTALVRDYLIVRKQGGEKKNISDEDDKTPFFALCMTTLDKNGSPIKEWDQINTLTRFHNQRQPMGERIPVVEFVLGELTFKILEMSEFPVTRFKDLACLWFDWKGLNLHNFEEAHTDVNITVKMKFDKNTNRVYFIPMTRGDLTLIDDDFNADTDIHNLLLKSSKVNIRFDRVEKQVRDADTRLCPENRRRISKCVTEEAINKWGSLPFDAPFVGLDDTPFTNAANQFLPQCLSQCASKPCIATTFKRTSNIENPSIQDGRKIVEVAAKMQFPCDPKTKIKNLPRLRPSLESLIKIAVLWTLLEIVFYVNFSVTPITVAIIAAYSYLESDKMHNWIT